MTSSARQLISEEPTVSSRHFQHIRELDGVRGIAALMVFFHHVCFTSISLEGWGAPVRFLRTVSVAGSSGVDLFFVLSGFLITSLLIEARGTTSYYPNFYWKRALRILPLYILCLLVSLLFIPGSRNAIILSMLFLSNFSGPLHITNTGPFWTLAIEEQFYLIWPTVIRRRSIDQLLRWALFIGLASIILRFIAAFFGHYNYQPTFFRCDGLAVGALLACIYRRESGKQNLTIKDSGILVAFIVGLGLIALSSIPETQLRAMAFLAALGQTGITFLGGSLIAFVIGHSEQKSLFWLRSPFLTFFGLISYAMYMIHLYVMSWYDTFFGPLRAGDNGAYTIRFFAILSVTIIFCLLCRYLIELPAISLRKYVLVRPRT